MSALSHVPDTGTAGRPLPTRRAAPDHRPIVHRTAGRRHGPITRVVSPGDLGEVLKPFVFLDTFDVPAGRAPAFGMHPHSGIATVTVLLSGDLRYEDTTGATGVLQGGGVEWMRAGRGVWHHGAPERGDRFRGYQVWLALPEALELAPAHSVYVPPSAVPQAGPARVVLGTYADVRSTVPAFDGINLLHVRLAAGEQWMYQPPPGHTIAWTHVNTGSVDVSGETLEGALAVFAQGEGAPVFRARDAADFIVASAVAHPHPLVLGDYSVHTSTHALNEGEAEIERIGARLRAAGRLR